MPAENPALRSPEDVTTAVSEARLRVAARRAARRQHIGVTFGPNAQVITNELGTFVEGSLFYKIEGF